MKKKMKFPALFYLVNEEIQSRKIQNVMEKLGTEFIALPAIEPDDKALIHKGASSTQDRR